MKKVALGLIVIVLVAAGAVGYFRFMKKSDGEPHANQASQNREANDDPNKLQFESTEKTPMVVTITTKADGKTATTTMQFDGEGRSQYEAKQNGQVMTFIIDKTHYYTSNDVGCYKFANMQEQQGETDPKQYQFDQTKIDELSAEATYKGKQSCSRGTCDVWELKNFQSQGSAEVFVDSATKRISSINSQFNGSTTTITYAYQPVTI